jgi:uncharacterized small protein (DUF1192 family)
MATEKPKSQLQHAIARSRARISTLQQEIEQFVADMGADPTADFTDEIVALHAQIDGEKQKLAAYESAVLIAQDHSAEDQALERAQQVLGHAELAFELAAQRTEIARQMQAHLQQFLGLKQQYEGVDEHCHHYVVSVAAYHYNTAASSGFHVNGNLHAHRPSADGRAPQGLFQAVADAITAHAHGQPPVAACEWKEQHIRQMVRPWLPQVEEVSA